MISFRVNFSNMNDTSEIKINEKIVETILKNNIATNWSTSQYTPYKLTTLVPDSSEYKTIEDLFTSKYYTGTVRKIERIENPYLLGHYLLKKEKLEQKHGRVDERLMFHGTKTVNLDRICTSNFDWRLNGQSRGCKFGRGVNFSPSAFYAHHFGDVLILVRVLVMNCTIGSMFTEIPEEPYDTTTNGKDTVYVKYEDDDFLPEYIVHY